MPDSSKSDGKSHFPCNLRENDVFMMKLCFLTGVLKVSAN